SSSVISGVGNWPTRLPTRSTATERTCSACALESWGKPVRSAGNRTWKGYTRVVFEVTGTTVITPRPSWAAVALAASLLTITAGRVLLASDPREGSRLTMTISPRRIQLPRPSAMTVSHASASSEEAHESHASSYASASWVARNSPTPYARPRTGTLYPGPAHRSRGTPHHPLAG